MQATSTGYLAGAAVGARLQPGHLLVSAQALLRDGLDHTCLAGRYPNALLVTTSPDLDDHHRAYDSCFILVAKFVTVIVGH